MSSSFFLSLNDSYHWLFRVALCAKRKPFNHGGKPHLLHLLVSFFAKVLLIYY